LMRGRWVGTVGDEDAKGVMMSRITDCWTWKGGREESRKCLIRNKIGWGISREECPISNKGAWRGLYLHKSSGLQPV
jgi:hypothetical protein